MDLLEKFLSIEMKLEDQVPVTDREFCMKEQVLFEKTRDQLAASEKHCRQQMIEAANDHITLYEDATQNNRNHSFYPFVTKTDPDSTSSTQENIYGSFEYGWAYAIRDIYRLRRKLIDVFITRIKDHFIKTYHLELPRFLDNDLKELTIQATWIDVLEMIKTAMGGILDFKGGAVEQAVEKFRNYFNYSKPILKGSIIEFPYYIYWDRGKTTYKFDRWGHEKNLKDLDAAISVFELEEVRTNYAVMYLIDKEYHFDWETPLNGEKIDGVKFFKNRKMQIKFKDPLLAKQFINRFQLNTVNS